jgi:hypothetical protein
MEGRSCYRLIVRGLVCACAVLASGVAVRGDFGTVINVPPNIADFTTIGSNTQVNLHDGGSIGSPVRIGSSDYPMWPSQQWGSSSHIELNIYGGSVGDWLQAGSLSGQDSDIVVNLFGGSIGDSFQAHGGTTVNIAGGSIGNNFTAVPWYQWGNSPPTANPVVVNLSGGSIGQAFGVAGTLNMSGGTFGNWFEGATTFNMSGGVLESELRVEKGSVANISGGQINSYVGVAGVANITGGTIGSVLNAGQGGVINLSGGTAGQAIDTSSGTQLSISGGDYRLDGVPIAGLGFVGNSLGFNVPSGSVLTGALSDGTPFAITGQNVAEGGDSIADGTLTLHTTAIPAAPPTAFHSPGGPTPRGLRAGQSLTVADGGTIGNSFNASWGSAVTITGTVGDNFEAIGATVNISGGTVGDVSNAFMGSVFNVSGGSIGSNFTAARGSQVNITGGKVGELFEVQAGGTANVSGGAIAEYFRIFSGGQLNISGGEFRLNGIPISGLSSAGSTKAIDIPAGALLSGTLSDGTPFAFSDQESDYVAAGTLTLRATALPTPGPAVIQVPHDPAPKGLRTGQSLLLSEGGVLGEKFTAGWGSSVTISGGQIGDSFKAIGAVANISGGTFNGRFHAAYGSLVNISGGTFSGTFFRRRGASSTFRVARWTIPC